LIWLNRSRPLFRPLSRWQVARLWVGYRADFAGFALPIRRC